MSDMIETSREQRWRLILGSGADQALGGKLGGDYPQIDAALATLYDVEPSGGDSPQKGKGGLGASSPKVARWLGDIRRFFPTDVVRMIQKDAMERLDLKRLMLEPELLSTMEPDVNLVATIISLKALIPAKTKETARLVVRKVAEDLRQRIEEPLKSAIMGALDRSARNNAPRHSEIDWNRTIRLNLKHYQSEYQTIIPERRVGYGRRQRRSLRDIIVCIDQSGSMAASVVYSSILGAVMASIPAVTTSLVVFDTAVVDLTPMLSDPVDVLFGVQLGGGTDINRAVSYCQSIMRSPQDTILVLISDLYEGGVAEELVKRVAFLIGSGVQVIVLLALCDDGAASYDAELGARLAELGAPAFACTPDKFPSLMAAAIQRQDIALWAANNQETKGGK